MRLISRKIFPSLILLAFASIVFIYVFFLSGCAHPHAQPDDIYFWAGSSQDASIHRSQENRAISCKQSEFDDYVCLKYEDLRELMESEDDDECDP